MSNTVLSFMDFFWIWFVVAIASGGTTYLQKDGTFDKNALESFKQQLAILTEEIQNLKRDIGRTS
jgi:uncharacterized membrane protein (DUF106 family)